MPPFETIEKAMHDPPYIGIHGCIVYIEGKGAQRRHGIRTDAGQCAQTFRIGRKPAAVLPDHRSC